MYGTQEKNVTVKCSLSHFTVYSLSTWAKHVNEFGKQSAHYINIKVDL